MPEQGLQNRFDAPIPGESLTDTPGNAKWEHPPQFTKVEEASEYIIYQGNHLKWYEGYKDVDEINSFIDDMAYDCCADDEFNVFGRMMVCIGEDNAIHGEIGDYFDIFNINTVVELQ